MDNEQMIELHKVWALLSPSHRETVMQWITDLHCGTMTREDLERFESGRADLPPPTG